jgi:hypothetical protein
MKRTLLIAMLVVALVIDLRGLRPTFGWHNLEGLGRAHAQTGSGPLTLLGASYDLTWYTIEAGGAGSAASGYALVGTAGQPDAGAAMSGGGFTLVGGFWGSAASQYKVYLPMVIR